MRFLRQLRYPAAVLAFCLIHAAGGFALSEEQPPASQFFVLDNGLKVFLLERPGLPLAHIAAAVHVGSGNESTDISGVSHLLEHVILFRGTENRSGDEISLDIRRHGAYVNAYTGHDFTFFITTLPSAHASFGLENLKDTLFHLEVDAGRLEEEKAVLLDEIRHVGDDPFRFGTALVLEHLFAGHPYALPVHGRPDALENLTADQVRDFYVRYFVPGNTALAVVGNIRVKEIEPLIRRIFSTVPERPVPAAEAVPARPPARNVEIEHRMDVSQAYVFLGFSVPEAEHGDRYALEVLAEILGKGVHPLLYAALRARRDLVHSVSVNYLGLRRGGALIAVLTLDPKNHAAAKREALSFLRRLRNENFSPGDVFDETRYEVFDLLGNAKNQIRLGNEKARENGLNLASALARHILTIGNRPPVDYLAMIDAVSSTDLRRTSAGNLSRSHPVVVSLLPSEVIK